MRFFSYKAISKEKVYQTKCAIEQNFKNRITAEMRVSTPKLFRNVSYECYNRLACCQEVERAHFENLINKWCQNKFISI